MEDITISRVTLFHHFGKALVAQTWIFQFLITRLCSLLIFNAMKVVVAHHERLLM